MEEGNSPETSDRRRSQSKKEKHKKPPCRDRITYSKELSKFEKETLKKAEEFRLARSQWLSQNVVYSEDMNVEEGVKGSNLYKGRCVFLRKIGFKTTWLKSHYKTLRPLRYFTLDATVEDAEKAQSTDTMEKRRYFQEKAGKTIFSLRRKVNEEEEEETPVGGHAESSENFHDESRISLKKSDLEDELEKKPKKRWWQKRGGGPSKQALENLKASAKGKNFIESCKCDNGKEVTLVIKGYCPCQKMTLNKFKLSKVCDAYCKSEKSRAQGALSSIPPKVEDSIEIYKKRLDKDGLPTKSLSDKSVNNGNTLESTADNRTTSTKSVNFGKSSEPSPANKTISTKSVNFGKDLESTVVEKTPSTKSVNFGKSLEPKEVEKTPSTKSVNFGKSLEPTIIAKTPSSKSVNFGKPIIQEKKDVDQPKDNDSVVTLFKNKQAKASKMALTQEQKEKLQYKNELQTEIS